VYADEGLVAETDAAGNVVKSYGYRPGSTWTTDPLFLKVGGQYYFYQNDHLGTPQKLTAVNGAVVWSVKYSSFGEVTVEVESIENHLRFPGQYFDQETNFHYNYQRYYDPKIARYLKEDPIGFDGGINLYSYVFSNPLNLLDAFGLKSKAGPEAFCCNPDGTVNTDPKCCKDKSPHEKAAAWAQYMYENPDSTNWKFYTSKYNADKNRPQGYDRCNTFVWDSYRKGGKVPNSKIPKSSDYPKWPAFANDIANTEFENEKLSVVDSAFDLQPGDIVAWPSNNEESGHTGIIGCNGRIINARSDKIDSFRVIMDLDSLKYRLWRRSPVYRRPNF